MSYSDIMNSPLGILTVTCDDNHLLRIDFGSIYTEINPNSITKLTINQLNEYFEGKRKVFELPVLTIGTEFQNRVWCELVKIPYGEVITYGELARRIGNARCSRAVGNANNKNCIPIVIPCHRVVASDGIGGYAPGVSYKKILLDLEKKCNESE